MNTSSLCRIRAARGHSAMDCSASVLLVGRHRVGLDDGVVLVVEIEQVGGDSEAHRVAFAAVTINFYVA